MTKCIHGNDPQTCPFRHPETGGATWDSLRCQYGKHVGDAWIPTPRWSGATGPKDFTVIDYKFASWGRAIFLISVLGVEFTMETRVEPTTKTD